jgi:putative photosynthetic complex assembly protein 2
MTEAWLPALYALFLWWFGTGAVLLIDRLPRRTRRGGMVWATLAAFGALYAIDATAGVRDMQAALVAFTATIVIWGWHELSFLNGMITGPRRTPCPPGATGWRRFRFAAETLIHHEIAIALTGVALLIWLKDAANPVALWAYGILWAMRLSAKFNLFLGAPNVADEFLTDDLAYLKSYFSQRPINLLFPVSVTVGTVATVWLAIAAGQASAFDAAALGVAAMLTGLGTLEHWFLVLPYREAALWRWYMNVRAEKRAKRAAAAQDLSPLAAPTMLGR